MRFDFWNNPLVVSALRLKYRRSSPGILAGVWVLGLVGAGVIMHQVATAQDFRFPTFYLLVILSLQFVVCGAIALAGTAGSMHAEVVNRTLDFQRIVTLSPRAILVGKMLGEPAISYFLALATLPLAAVCWGLGAASGGVILWFYVNLATFLLMCAAAGLLHNLAPPSQPSAGKRSGGGGWAFIALFFIVPQFISFGTQLVDVPGIGDLLQLVTPLGSLIHMWKDNAWNARVTFWNVSIPSLIAAPIVQTALAAWLVGTMARRLKNPIDPAVTKLGSYLTVATIDLALAGILYANWRNGIDADDLVYVYFLIHIAVCVLVSLAAVPRRAAILSWIWRRGHEQPRLGQLLLADRAEFSLAAVVLGLVGPAVLLIGFVAPMAAAAAPASGAISISQLAQVAAVTFVVVVGSLLVHQLIAAATDRGGQLLFFLFLLAANALPAIAAALLAIPEAGMPESVIDGAGALSPAYYFVRNIARFSDPLSPWGLLILYAALAASSYLLLERLLRRHARTVATKLQSMGVA